MVLIDALFINKGGGAVLLQYLLQTVLAGKDAGQFFFLLDPRFDKPAGLKSNYTVIPNTIRERIKFYRQNGERFSKVFCFANTAPPVRLKVPVYTYMHNQKLLEAPRQKFKKDYRRIYAKYLYVKLFNRNTDYYIVQTPHMIDEMVRIGLKAPDKCLSIAFYDDSKYKGEHTPFGDRVPNEFVFISNPSPQKNYPTLFDAWEYLLAQGHKPVLHVTVDETAPAFITRINNLNARGAQIVNHIRQDPRALYYTRPYLIFPSIMESFGLPLIEAVDSGMKILASDLPYVYDVVRPSITFQPYDKTSIAHAVLRAMNEELLFPELVARNQMDELLQLLLAE